MEKAIEVSFLVPGDKYGEFKDICKLKNTNPSIEFNKYIQEVIQKDKDSFKGFRIVYVSLCSSEERKSALAYKGWEKNRQQKIANLVFEKTADLLIVEDYISEKSKPFSSSLEENDYQKCYEDTKCNYSIWCYRKKIGQLATDLLTYEIENDDGDTICVYPVPHMNLDKSGNGANDFYRMCKMKKKNGIIIGHYALNDKKRVLVKTIAFGKPMNCIARCDIKAKELGLSDCSMYYLKILNRQSVK